MKKMKTRTVKKSQETDEGWTLELRQQLWTLYVEGASEGEMIRALGKNINMIGSERWKINVQYYANRDPESEAGRQQALVRGPNRQGLVWGRRDVRILRLGRKHKPPVPITKLAELLGRTEDEVRQRMNPRHGMKAFF